MNNRVTLWGTGVLFVLMAYAALGQKSIEWGFGGGELYNSAQHQPCISEEQYAAVQQQIAAYHATYGYGHFFPAAPAPYRFYPLGGTISSDLFITNFTDLDPTSGILDWDCTDFTYNGHTGHDTDIRTFGEQDIGVPIFAALDGTVVAAHDGEFDRNTTWENQPANYVILWHGGTHYTYYWHMKRDSVAVVVNQIVKAGQQIGQVGSSGISTYPHLHFESRYANQWYEPYAGNCRPGDSNWTHQTPIRRDMYLRDFNMTNVNIANYPGLPHDMPRTGTFLTGTRRVSWWINVHNQPANSTWRARIMRPNHTVALDTGTQNFNNSQPFRWAWWWWWYNLNLNQTGFWHFELYINNLYMAHATFKVVSSADQIVNHAPSPVLASFDPPAPTPADVVFLRIHTILTEDDADFDIVRYRYVWKINGHVVRDVTTAGHADALPHSMAQNGDTLECSVTPSDGNLMADTYTKKFRYGRAGDVDGDGCVNDSDLLAVLFAFGQSGGYLRADLDLDGIVSDSDLLLVLFNFGQGCS